MGDLAYPKKANDNTIDFSKLSATGLGDLPLPRDPVFQAAWTQYLRSAAYAETERWTADPIRSEDALRVTFLIAWLASWEARAGR